jgi:hypothetical protein
VYSTPVALPSVMRTRTTCVSTRTCRLGWLLSWRRGCSYCAAVLWRLPSGETKRMARWTPLLASSI